MIIKKIEIPIYFGELLICIGETNEEVEKKFKVKNTIGCDAFVIRQILENGFTKYAIVFFKDIKPTPKIIVHECIHLKNMLFKDRCIKLDRDNDEPEAYFTGWLFSVIFEYLKLIKFINYGRNHN